MDNYVKRKLRRRKRATIKASEWISVFCSYIFSYMTCNYNNILLQGTSNDNKNIALSTTV